MIYSPIIPIPSFFNEDESLNLDETSRYLDYLYDEGAEIVMTTSGTSLFHLLSTQSIVTLNNTIHANFPSRVILGLPPRNVRGIKHLIEYTPDCYSVLLQYPERYYSDKEIIDYFKNVADNSHHPIWIHGHPLRSGYGLKWVDFPLSVLKELREHPNVTGLKEENTTFQNAYEISRLANNNFIVCCAGVSGRRFLLCKNAGAQTYLAGMGNLFYNLEKQLYQSINNVYWNYPTGEQQIQEFLEIENEFFDIANNIGWHLFLRTAIKILEFSIGNRKPFPILDKNSTHYLKIKNLVEKYR